MLISVTMVAGCMLRLLARIGRGEGHKYYREEEILVRSNGLGFSEFDVADTLAQSPHLIA